MSPRQFGLAALATMFALASALVCADAGPRAQSPGRASESGAELFRAYCAPCHGAKGRGDGPVAASFKVQPTDLTRLARENKGEFPSTRVAGVLEFGIVVPAHGTTDMPAWGPTFRVMGDDRAATARVAALTAYVESIQAK